MVDFHPVASLEVVDAAEYYEERLPRLGDQFLDALRLALERIEAAPLEQPPWLSRGIPKGVRHAIVRGFQHSVVFIVEPRLYGATVRHHSQHPTRWVERLDEA